MSRVEVQDAAQERFEDAEADLAAVLEPVYGRLVQGVLDALGEPESKALREAETALNPGTWEAAVRVAAEQVVYQIGTAAARDVGTDAGVPVGVDAPEVQRAVEEAVRVLLDTTAARAAEIRKALLDPKTSAWDLEELVRSRFGTDEQREIWAQVAARRTVAGGVNGGAYAGARLAGLTTKTWLSSRDDRVRPTHTRLGGGDGQTKKLDEPYIIGGFPMRYPGDPYAPPQERFGCRCVSIYE